MNYPEKLKDSNMPDLFELWLASRPKWLQTAARNLLDNQRMPDEKEVSILAKLCIDEANGIAGLAFASIRPGSLSTSAPRPALRIAGLLDVQGVSAIKSGAALSFGNANITVVYGPNGSGKTGFSRLLKQACGSKAKEAIHSNVFDAREEITKAKIQVSINDQPHVLDWSGDSVALTQLRDVHVFDSKSAGMYIGSNNEATYEPRRMRFLSALVTICDRVTAYLDADKLSRVRKMPAMPGELLNTTAQKWLVKISAKTTAVEIEKICSYTKELDDKRIATEAALAQKDISGRLLVIAKDLATLSKVKNGFAATKTALADAQIQLLIDARNEAKSKRTAATNDAKKVFEQAPLEGVGQSSWMALWNQARKYSELHAYPDTPFPVTGADSRCVLCQQPLTEDGKARISHFEAFVKNGLEADAISAEKKVSALSATLPVLPHLNDWLLQSGILKMDEEVATKCFVEIQNRRNAADAVTHLQDLPAIEWSVLELAVATLEKALANEEKSLKDLLQDANRKQLELEVIELRATQWLSQNKQAVVDEVSRLTGIAHLEKAAAISKTNALTTKKNELAKQELEAGYQTRFVRELNLLGGTRIPIRPESKQEGKGKISFGLALQGSKKIINTTSVLSEGESRIVALSAFLADITGLGQPIPFVFDDPISSLDQGFEERVVTRLVDLAKDGQVIVFTHRLSMLTLIESAVDRFEKKAALEKAPVPVTLHVEALYRLGNAVGISHQLNIRDSKPQKAVNRLRDEVIPKLQKLIDKPDVPGYEERAKSVCSDYRILVERCVEKILFNDVLQRFRRSVETKGRIGALAKINPADCAFIDDLMTRYSVFEHSQPDEFPAALPDFDVLSSDVSELAKWIGEFEKRAVT